MKHVGKEHPLRQFFGELIHDSLYSRIGIQTDEVEEYLIDLMLDFVHQDGIFSIRNAEGQRIESVAEMLVEGDVTMNANSFERERQVHKHIGDFLLFWSGMYPEFLRQMRSSADALLDPVSQGKYSYHVVSTFEHDPFGEEAPIFRQLSEEFEWYQYGLKLVRVSFENFKRQGWTDGFSA